MRQTWKIARWEVMRNLTNKQFIIGLLITPLIMVVFGGIPILLEYLNRPSISTYYVIDHIGIVEEMQELLPENVLLEPIEDSESITDIVKSSKASGYFILDEQFFTTGEINLVYSDRNSNPLNAVQKALSSLLQQKRLSASGIDPEQLSFVTAQARVREIPIEEEFEPRALEMLVSMVFAFLIFFLTVTSASMLMQSAVQEKRDRMAEVVLSSVRAGKLMQGKVIGHFILGLIQLSFWLAIGLPLAFFFLDLPVMEIISAVNIPFILFFGLGSYLMFSSIFVGIGATMEDIQSAGNSQGLVVLLPMMSFLFLNPVLDNPDGNIAVFASIFPLTSPTIMMMRNGLTVIPLWQKLLSGGLLLITVFVTIRLASKIFRIGMLMYGKNASFKEIFKWLRYKES